MATEPTAQDWTEARQAAAAQGARSLGMDLTPIAAAIAAARAEGRAGRQAEIAAWLATTPGSGHVIVANGERTERCLTTEEAAEAIATGREAEYRPVSDPYALAIAHGFRAGLAAAEAAFPSTDPALPTVPVVLFADVIRARIRALIPKEPK